MAGWVLGINPFDQPNVQEAKDDTKPRARPRAAEDQPDADRRRAAGAAGRAGRAALPRGHGLPRSRRRDFDAAVERAARRRSATRRGRRPRSATGPRFLHSTGQLHKGGPPTGRFLQLVHDSARRRRHPGAPTTPSRDAQARAGDRRPARPCARTACPPARVTLEGDDPAAALRRADRAPEGARVSAVAERAENPLIEGLERLPVHPTTLVIFGATGDLAKRKLLPALYNLAHEGALPERFNLIGVSRSEHAARGVPRRGAGGHQGVLAARARSEPCSTSCSTTSATCRGPSTTPRSTTTLGKTLDEFDKGAGARMNRCFYLSTAPMFFPVIVGQLGESKLCRHEGADVRVVIEKPFGTTLAEAEQLNREVLSRPRRAAGLPHRPLPGQGDRPEHAWRSGSPTGCSSRSGTATTSTSPDHRRGGHRDRLARGLLRLGRRAARPDPEPHAPAAVPRRDGAAGRLHRRRGAQREGQGAAGDPRADRGADRRDRGARAVRRGRVGRRARRAATCRRTTSRRTPTPRPTRPCGWRSTTGAGPACPSTCARGSAWPARSPRSR